MISKGLVEYCKLVSLAPGLRPYLALSNIKSRMGSAAESKTNVYVELI